MADGRKRFEAIDEWLRRRLRAVRWKQWKRVRTRIRELRALGMPPGKAYQWGMTSKGVWRLAGSAPLQRAMPNSYWDDQGLRGMAYHWHLRRGA